MSEFDNPVSRGGHEERFHDLCALAPSGHLSTEERAELEEHLKTCPECREACQEYEILAKEGMALLAAEFAPLQEKTDAVSDEMVEANRRKVLDRLAASNLPSGKTVGVDTGTPLRRRHVSPYASRRVLALAAAALLAVGLCVGSYRVGQRRALVPLLPPPVADPRIASITSEKMAAENLAATEKKELERLRSDAHQKGKELAELQLQLTSAESSLNRAVEEKSTTEAELRQTRDTFAEQIRQKEQAYDEVQTELMHLRTEREKTLLQLTSLEQKVETLSAENAEESHRAKEEEGYLAADRDIRELMGARQLYIADVFDVSSDSRTRKPYGRVFYTKGKSLIFYAFDLDRQAGLKNANTFQVWGTNESAQDRPVNLGVLFVDSEANRRWALRCDDPQQLAQIDAVFVTVEPNAFSHKPTGKPFLYASLRKEPNHP
jgi:hypothetical protein